MENKEILKVLQLLRKHKKETDLLIRYFEDKLPPEEEKDGPVMFINIDTGEMEPVQRRKRLVLPNKAESA